ncbi:hypothetical protein SLS62_008362 [Diatrype stigma]|uniref:C2H2-type domain-containing protein n=1 Tax=Diatrype stigma TaxID=117547 RepID=A0AAN9YM03_9PEZI
MGRGPSDRGYSSSRWSTAAVSPSASSPGGYSPESPGSGITDSLSAFNFDSNNATTGSESQQQGYSWVQYYDFIATTIEQGQTPYWQLKAGYTPSKDYPAIMPAEADSTPRSTEILHPCLAPGCDSKPFKRKADLERHYQQVHWDSATKTSYPCDYPRCPRATEYFYRRDHCRDHYREYHKEDLVRRSPGGGGGGGGSSSSLSPCPSLSSSSSSRASSSSSSSSRKRETAEWWADRNVSKKWWRCAKCLRRVAIQLDGFECRDCKAVCETERRRFRGYA